MIITIRDANSKEYITLQILKVEGAGVINVRNLSEISFCVIPLIHPVAPSVLMISVITKNNRLPHACLILFILPLLRFIPESIAQQKQLLHIQIYYYYNDLFQIQKQDYIFKTV